MCANKDVGQVIHIGTGFDRNYLRPFLALVGSIIKNHTDSRFEIHAIVRGLSDEEKHQISALVARSGNAISYYEVTDGLIDNLVLTGGWSSVVYYRLFFGSLLPKTVDRILYLDCDTLVVSSLLSLYTAPLDGRPVGAVYDNFVKAQPLIGIVKEGEYFNSGVLVIDMEAWRREQVSEKAIALIGQHPDRILYVDQCALNAVLRDNWKKLDVKFNLMYSALPEGLSKGQMKAILENSVVVHFTLQRPWQMLCRNRLRFLYFYYLDYAGVTSGFWRNYTDFQVRKLPAWLKIRLVEFYFDSPNIQRVWRALHQK